MRVRDQAGHLVAFMGVAEQKIEALFVHPTWHGAGVGTLLLRHAVESLGADKVDVNEQNAQAVRFYERQGFVARSRSELDDMGLPFPILHMELRR